MKQTKKFAYSEFFIIDKIILLYISIWYIYISSSKKCSLQFTQKTYKTNFNTKLQHFTKSNRQHF
ncbi:MAG: hypothetical protein A3F93_02955 [Candidatus Magasanikbacteria bacterium RIFCSPLOWO2_12_FULL_34_7]|nr:MAG: hypothetical protein A3F93_02955 [Candidatus Magasanikbacteria bacterium RIFCSPLOWO2_12_FULL_34_7]